MSYEVWIVFPRHRASIQCKMFQISKNIAFSRQNVSVEQTQVMLGYCRKSEVYGVDTVTQVWDQLR